MTPPVSPADEAVAESAPVSKAPGARSTLWVAWNDHRRTTGLCDAWEVPLEVIRAAARGPLRWCELPLRTLGLLRRRRPEILFVQNPSLALAVLAAICRPAFGYCLVVDAHNEGVRPFDRPYRLVQWLTRRVLRSADWTVVSNAALVADVEAAGGRALVLPDRLPTPSPENRSAPEPVDVVVVATFRRDEPIEAILEAAAALSDCRFAITGDAGRTTRVGPGKPPNVSLTGYLADPDYWDLLRRARVVCDLTLKPDCLVCGAYEALAVATPMVLSDNAPTRSMFGTVAVLTESHPGAITAALRSALARREQLQAAAADLRDTYPGLWRRESRRVTETIWSQAHRRDRGTA